MSVQQRFLYAILWAGAMGLQQAEETEEVGRRMRGAAGLEREREKDRNHTLLLSFIFCFQHGAAMMPPLFAMMPSRLATRGNWDGQQKAVFHI